MADLLDLDETIRFLEEAFRHSWIGHVKLGHGDISDRVIKRVVGGEWGVDRYAVKIRQAHWYCFELRDMRLTKTQPIVVTDERAARTWVVG